MRRKDFTVCHTDFERLEACPAARAFAPARREKVTFPQWRGIFIHRFLERCVSHGHEAAVDYIQGKRIKSAVSTCLAIDPEQLYYGQVEVGWCHAPSTDTARRVPWALMDTIDASVEQFGKADLLVEHGLERPIIADYKCGELRGPLPAARPQLLGLAAAYRAEAREAGSWAGELDVAIAGVRSTGAIDWVFQLVDDRDIDCYIRRARCVQTLVMEARQRADEGAALDFARSEWCEWCKLRKECPAWQ